jgi:hypothetical protein
MVDPAKPSSKGQAVKGASSNVVPDSMEPAAGKNGDAAFFKK